MKNTLGVAIIGGEGPELQALREIAGQAGVLVAVDSGLIAAEEAGLRPHWVLGDMDSLDDPSRLDKYPPDRVLRYPTDKDHTDTELALSLFEKLGCEEIWLAGGGGGRMDHIFAIRSLFDRPNPPDRWFTRNEEIRCIKEGETLATELPPGSLVSVFPLGMGPWEAESSGLKWPLNGLAWEMGRFGLSNVVEKGLFRIHSVQGSFLVIMGFK